MSWCMLFLCCYIHHAKHTCGVLEKEPSSPLAQQQHFTTTRQQGIVYPENRMHVYLQCKRRHRRHVSHGMLVSYSIGWGNGSRGNVFSYDCDVWGKVLCAINQVVCGVTSQLITLLFLTNELHHNHHRNHCCRML